jgi:hypothetical protein
MAVSSEEFSAVGTVRASPGYELDVAAAQLHSASADADSTPTGELRALARLPLERVRSRLATRALALPPSSPERAALERDLARIAEMLRTLA